MGWREYATPLLIFLKYPVILKTSSIFLLDIPLIFNLTIPYPFSRF